MSPLPATCLAEFVAKNRRSAMAILRPYKFKESGEGHARIVYHPPLVSLIRKFYKSNKDLSLIDLAIASWERKAEATESKSLRARLLSNAAAARLFRKRCLDKGLEILPKRTIACQIGQIVFTAPPDLWVKENGEERLIKIGFGPKPRSYIDALLIVMRKAALAHGHDIPAKNVAYLQASTGSELVSRYPYEAMALTLTAAAREIAETWAKVKLKDGKTATRSQAATASK